MRMSFSARRGAAAVLLAAASVATVAGVRQAIGSDHVDTAEVELSPTLDLNDVYVFPGSTDGRIVLIMDVASPTNALGRNVPRFDPNALYQFKIDTNGDAREDRVIQILFDDMTNGTQRVNVLGPAAPVNAAGDTTGMLNRLVAGPVLQGNFGGSFGTATAMQVFTGQRDDPFYVDFEQLVQILPDRRPATFLNNVHRDNRNPTAFCGAAAPFDTSCTPKDIFQGANTLSIVIELPESSLGVGTAAGASMGVWATIGR